MASLAIEFDMVTQPVCLGLVLPEKSIACEADALSAMLQA